MFVLYKGTIVNNKPKFKTMKKVFYEGSYPGDWVVGKKALSEGVEVGEAFEATPRTANEPSRVVTVELIDGVLPWDHKTIPMGSNSVKRASFRDLGTLYP